MTALEKLSLETLRNVLHHMTGRQLRVTNFMDLMSTVIETVKHLEKLETGCPSGTHFCKCTCRPASIGKSLEHVSK